MATLALDCIDKHGDLLGAVLCDISKNIRDRFERDRTEHYHQCGAREARTRRNGDLYYPGWDRKNGCGTIWSHRAVDIDDDSDDNPHACPACGRESYWAYDRQSIQERNKGKFTERYQHGKGIRHISERPDDCAAIFPVPSEHRGHG